MIDCGLITEYFIVDFSLLIPLEDDNANSSPDLMVCSEKLSVLCYVFGRSWAPWCVRRQLVCARAGESLDREASPGGKATRVTNGAQQHGQVLSVKAGLGAQPLAPGRGLGARWVKGCELLRPSLLCVQRKDWRPSDLLDLNACVQTSQKIKSVLKKIDDQ